MLIQLLSSICKRFQSCILLHSKSTPKYKIKISHWHYSKISGFLKLAKTDIQIFTAQEYRYMDEDLWASNFWSKAVRPSHTPSFKQTPPLYNILYICACIIYLIIIILLLSYKLYSHFLKCHCANKNIYSVNQLLYVDIIFLDCLTKTIILIILSSQNTRKLITRT